MRTEFHWRFALIVFLSGFSPSSGIAQATNAQQISEARQVRAKTMRRFDQSYHQVRKTGERAAVMNALDKAVDDLTVARRTFAQAGQKDDEAECLVLAARWRLQRHLDQLRDLFAAAEQAARAGGHPKQLAQALNGLTICRLYDSKEFAAAANSSSEAVRLAEKHADQQLLFETLCLRSELETARGELGAGLSWIERAFRIHSQSPIQDDDVLLFHAHLDRQDVCFKIAGKADTQTHFDYYEQMARQAIQDANAALDIAERNMWDALAANCRSIVRSVRRRLELIQLQRGFHESLAAGLKWLNPSRPEDVLVSRNFIQSDKCGERVSNRFATSTYTNRLRNFGHVRSKRH